MITVDIKADVKRVEKFFSNLGKNAVKRAASRAINDALITVRADGAREIKKVHSALTIGAIKGNMVIYRATPGNLQGKVETKGRPLSLKLFKPLGGKTNRRGYRAPVTAIMGTTRAVVSYHGRKGFRVAAFGDEIFVRTNATGKRIRRYRGPSLPGVFRAQATKFKQIAMKRWAIRFPAQMRFEIERAKT